MNSSNQFGLRRPLSLFLGACLTLAAATHALGAEAWHYLRAGQPDSAGLLAPPPLPNSAEQTADMAAVVAIYHACSTNDAALAFGEKKFSIFNFTPALGGCLQPGKFPKTEAFFTHVLKDAAAATGKAKEYWKRPRPFTTNPSLASGKLEKSFGYPSGHATESMVLALVLADLFPERREDILAVGRDIGWRRVWIARHYPTDIYAGRVLAQAIVRELKASAEFQHDLAEAKAEVASTARTGGTSRRTAALAGAAP
jgi:acid phosphatase (class A)